MRITATLYGTDHNYRCQTAFDPEWHRWCWSVRKEDNQGYIRVAEGRSRWRWLATRRANEAARQHYFSVRSAQLREDNLDRIWTPAI